MDARSDIVLNNRLKSARSNRISRKACTLRTGYCEDGHIQCRIRADIEPFEMV